MTETIDITGLVNAGLLDLDAVFDGADWRTIKSITTYTACIYGTFGDEPGEVTVNLQASYRYGITAYRWAAEDESGTYECGSPVLDREEASRQGEEFATENHTELDVDEIIDQIVATGYFGDATASDIRSFCEQATGYSCVYLLLPKGYCWTTNGYLECEYVTLPATYPNVAFAADALLRIITNEEE